MKEFIIGRAGNQPFKIEARGVSAEHARVTIDDSGNWTLEDLKGTNGNGTYVRDDQGNFVRIIKCNINEHTVIRLADVGHNSFTFMAHHLLVEDSKDFSYEFNYVYKLSEDLRQKEVVMELDSEKAKKKYRLIRIFVPFVAMGLTFLPIIRDQPFAIRLVIAGTSSLAGAFIPDDKSKMKELRKIRSAMIVCPYCQRTMSDYDLNNRRCSYCKAQ